MNAARGRKGCALRRSATRYADGVHPPCFGRKTLIRLACASLVASGLLACDPPSAAADSDPASSKDEEPRDGAQAAPEPSPEPSTKAPRLANLDADVDRSKVGFFIAKATAGHEAKFEHFTAKLVMRGDKPTKLNISLEVASLQTDQMALTKHLKSEDFFHAEKFPKATFASTSMAARPEPDEDLTHDVVGDLTIKGVTKSVEFPAAVAVEKSLVRGKATLEIEAKEFSIDYPGMTEELVDDTVELEIELVFPRP